MLNPSPVATISNLDVGWGALQIRPNILQAVDECAAEGDVKNLITLVTLPNLKSDRRSMIHTVQPVGP